MNKKAYFRFIEGLKLETLIVGKRDEKLNGKVYFLFIRAILKFILKFLGYR